MRVLFVHPSALMYNADRQWGEHQQPVTYELPLPEHRRIDRGSRRELYVHSRRPRQGNA